MDGRYPEQYLVNTFDRSLPNPHQPVCFSFYAHGLRHLSFATSHQSNLHVSLLQSLVFIVFLLRRSLQPPVSLSLLRILGFEGGQSVGVVSKQGAESIRSAPISSLRKGLLLALGVARR